MTEQPLPTRPPDAPAEPVDPSPLPPAPVPSPRRRLRFLFAPLRYAVRHPRRALLWLTCGAIVLALLGSVGGVLWFRSHLRAARDATDRWHNTEAIRHLSACESLWSDHPEVLLLSARVARRMGDWDESAGRLDRYTARHGTDDRVAFERLLHRAAAGELESVYAALRARIQAGGPDARAAREALIIGLSGRFLWREAETIALDWLAESPDDALAVLFRAKIIEEQGGQEPAIALFRRAIELDPELTEARLRLAGLLVTRRRGQEAVAELEQLRARLPDHPEVQILWVRALAMSGRGDEARAALEVALRAHPDNADALVERGTYALLDGDERLAEECLARAVRLDPANPTARNQYAMSLARNKKAAEAAAQYAEIRLLEADSERIKQLMRGPLQSRPNDPAVHHEIGTIALRSGQVRTALRWFQSALRADPTYRPTHLALAALYHDMGNPVSASRHRALAQQGSSPAPRP